MCSSTSTVRSRMVYNSSIGCNCSERSRNCWKHSILHLHDNGSGGVFERSPQEPILAPILYQSILRVFHINKFCTFIRKTLICEMSLNENDSRYRQQCYQSSSDSSQSSHHPATSGQQSGYTLNKLPLHYI